MTSVFDGMSGIISGVLGGPVLHVDASERRHEITALFRRRQGVAGTEEGGEVLVMMPVLIARAADAARISAGDLILPEGEPQHRVLARQASESPAADRLVTFTLEESR